VIDLDAVTAEENPEPPIPESRPALRQVPKLSPKLIVARS
jgi:hypothetical protein